HVAAVCESEEVAAGQARDLLRTRRELAQARRELAQARREHQNAVSERASLQEMSEGRLRQAEGERDEARTALDRARDELTHLGQKNTRVQQEKESLTGELARSAEALAAERNRTAGEEARVFVGKLRHGLQWRARRLARKLRHLRGGTAPVYLPRPRQTSAPPPRRGDGAGLSAAVGPNPNSAQTVTLRSESIFDSSPGMTRLTPSPNAVSSTRTPLTSEANSRGSIDAD